MDTPLTMVIVYNYYLWEVFLWERRGNQRIYSLIKIV